MSPVFSMQEAIDNAEALQKARRHIEMLVILANGCSKHGTYRGKTKIETACQRCRDIYMLRQRLIVEGVIDGER